MFAAVIGPDHKILAVIMADAAVDTITSAHGYPEGSRLVEAPAGANEAWTYDPVKGFQVPVYLEPPPGMKNGKPTNQVDF